MKDWTYINSFKRKYFDNLVGRKIHHRNVHLNPNWTENTIKTSLAIAFWAWEHDLEFYTEVPMIANKRRADFVIPEAYGAQIIEIHDSESLESIESKRVDYRKKNIDFLAVPADPERAINLIITATNIR